MLTSMGDVMRRAYELGWITTRDGNVSVRRGDEFRITPSGWRKTIIHPEFIVRAKIDGDKLVFKDGGIKKASGELKMHMLLQLAPGCKVYRSVVHLHPTYTIAAMHAGWNLQELANQFPEVSRYTRVGPNIPVLPVTSQVLAEATHKMMTDDDGNIIYDIVGQAGHGVCAIAKSPWDAFEHIERLEHICQIVLASGVRPK